MTTPSLPSTPVYAIIWEYRPSPELRAAFEEAYGENGDWVRFFQKGEGYLGTRLYHDLENEGRYLTVDMWESEAAYNQFREAHRADYVALDDRFEPLTIYERRIGAFLSVV